MFDISLRKVIIASAVIGGVAVAGYYSYKWLTKDTNVQEIHSNNSETDQSVDNDATTEGPPLNTTETEIDADVVMEVAHVQKDNHKMAEKVGQVKNDKEMAATSSHANSTLENSTADGAKDAESEPNRGETVTAKRAVTVEDEHLGACGGSQSRKKAIQEIIAAAAVDRLANLLPEEWSSKMRNESKD